jgi:hypothetical protein
VTGELADVEPSAALGSAALLERLDDAGAGAVEPACESGLADVEGARGLAVGEPADIDRGERRAERFWQTADAREQLLTLDRRLRVGVGWPAASLCAPKSSTAAMCARRRAHSSRSG